MDAPKTNSFEELTRLAQDRKGWARHWNKMHPKQGTRPTNRSGSDIAADCMEPTTTTPPTTTNINNTTSTPSPTRKPQLQQHNKCPPQTNQKTSQHHLHPYSTTKPTVQPQLKPQPSATCEMERNFLVASPQQQPQAGKMQRHDRTEKTEKIEAKRTHPHPTSNLGQRALHNSPWNASRRQPLPNPPRQC